MRRRTSEPVLIAGVRCAPLAPEQPAVQGQDAPVLQGKYGKEGLNSWRLIWMGCDPIGARRSSQRVPGRPSGCGASSVASLQDGAKANTDHFQQTGRETTSSIPVGTASAASRAILTTREAWACRLPDRHPRQPETRAQDQKVWVACLYELLRPERSCADDAEGPQQRKQRPSHRAVHCLPGKKDGLCRRADRRDYWKSVHLSHQ